MDNLANHFLRSFGFVIYTEFRRQDFCKNKNFLKGLFFIPYATLLTVVVFDKMGFKKKGKKSKRKFCKAEKK